MSVRHQPRIVTDADLEKALDFLRDSAKEIGDAKARLVMAGHMVKHIEAIESKMSSEKSAEGRKADARCSARYMAAIEEDAAATGSYEAYRALREAAALKIEAWRSEQANFRAMRI
jgi:rhamnose utilization protein RhaD (predicted bifunctional aldolase and dehydrogenase)